MTRILLIAAIIGFVIWTWRNAEKPRTTMSRDEAARFLGVSADADAAAVQEAHKRLIARVHPDAGGSAELAARVNMARDVLLQTPIR